MTHRHRLARATAAAVAALLALGLAAAAVAQQSPTVRIRGEAVKLEGDLLQVKDRKGEALSVKLAPNFRVTELRKAELSEIKEGTYIGVTALPQKDGTLRAVAIHIFPPAAKGTAEGHRPWDLMPEATMTNATVDGVVTQGTGCGSTIKVKYKDGEKTVIVTPETAIVAMGPGTPAMLTPGAKIMIFGAAKAADGGLSTQNVVVGKDGLTPPM
jgi:hypothetical protein